MTAAEAGPGPVGAGPPSDGADSLAAHTARGFLINAAFMVGVQLLVLVQYLLVPRLIGPEALGLFALAMAGVSVGQSLKQVGTHQKLVQDRETDLPLAYSVAFTLEIALSTVLFFLVLATGPILAAIYDSPELIPLVAFLALTIYTNALLNLPSAIHQRHLEWGRQNLLKATGPSVNAVVSVVLALLGAGVWSLAGGAVAALVVSAAVAFWGAPLRPRFRYDRVVVTRYLRFGWPLWLASLVGLATTWLGPIVISKAISIAALGFFTVAQSLMRRAYQLDAALAETIFPVLCQTIDDPVAQRRAFAATNRITVLWAATVGFGMVLFSGDLVSFVLGDDWSDAVFLLRMHGVAVILGSVGYSWDTLFQARSETKPILAVHVISEIWVFVVLLPAAMFGGLNGAAWAVGSMGVLAIVVRQHYVSKVLPGLNLLVNVSRELAALGAVAAGFGLLRQVWSPVSLVTAAAQGALFVASCLVIGALVDRSLVARVRGAVAGRVRSRGQTAPPVGTDESGTTDSGAADPLGDGTLSVPGRYPLWLTPNGRGLWVTCRDSSSLARFDLDRADWKTWRMPAWPHVAAADLDDPDAVWVGLTLSGRFSRVSATGPVEHHRLRRSHEVLVAASTPGAAWLVDAGNGLLWHVHDGDVGHRLLPAPLVRPDFVVPDDRGRLWITDTAAPLLGVLSDDPDDHASHVVEVDSCTRAALVDPVRGELWVGHADRGAISVLSLDDPSEQRHIELPGVPRGLARDDAGIVWVAVKELDLVVGIGPDGIVDRWQLAPGAEPQSVCHWQGRLWVTCPGRDEIEVR